MCKQPNVDKPIKNSCHVGNDLISITVDLTVI